MLTKPLPTRPGRLGGVVLVLWAICRLDAAPDPTHPFIKSYADASTCTRCHPDAAAQVMLTSHWTWEHTVAGSGKKLGKKHVINNYCVAVSSNEPRCTSCHIGVGYKDSSFNFSDASRVDCLVCHDTTGTYKKFPTLAGAPWTGPGTTNFGGATWEPVDLLKVAQNVGLTSRATCGACHFFGGGGDAVKHGDLDSSLYNPDRELDVHMGVNGKNFRCTTCHKTQEHRVSGSYYEKDHADSQSCEQCHTAAPHTAGAAAQRLNAHTARVGCQTCHIPAFARGRTTKMSWDWSTAGRKTADGKTMVVRDGNKDPIYDTQKGDFTWARDVVPEYVWFNGQVDYLTVEDVVDPTGIVGINRLTGEIADVRSRILPVKRFTGVQPYDPLRAVLAVPHLFGADPDAYWKGYNWTNALRAGMSSVGQDFSGQVGWVRTEMFWVQNHMVAPKERALGCADCHVPHGRLDFTALGYAPDRAARLQTLSGFEIAALTVDLQRGSVQLRWPGTPGYQYRVQHSSDLQVWADAPGGLVSAGAGVGELQWTDESAPASGYRFYRILRESGL